jgi:exosortase
VSLTVDSASAPVAASTATARAQTRPAVAGAVVTGLLALVYAPTLAWLFDRWTISVWHNAHGMFVPPLVAWLIYTELRQRQHLPASHSAWGFVLLIPALLLHALDAGMHTQVLSATSILIALPGLSLLLLGWPRTRAILFPLAFLAFALPIPLGVTESLHLLLRKITVVVGTPLLPLLGISVYVEGTTLHTSRGALMVADACSGFSTLYAAMAVACLAAFTAASWQRRALVLLLAAPIAIAANVLRVVFLVAMVVWQGEAILHTSLHPLSGMATFALALPIIFWLGGPPPAKEQQS